MLNIFRGVLGGLLGALVGGVAFIVTWYALALFSGPVTGPMPGLYFSLALGTLSGVFLAMGSRAGPAWVSRFMGLAGGFGIVGLMVGHFAGRLIYWAMGEGVPSVETLGTVPEGAAAGIHAITLVGTLLGLFTGGILAGGSLTRRSRVDAGSGEEPPTGTGAVPTEASGRSRPPGRVSGAEPPGEKGGEAGKGGKEESEKRELPRSRAPGPDEVPMGEHPADSMSVEDLLGESKDDR